MAKIISVVSGKGGTGKTTISINVSLALKSLGYRVVLIDGNITMPHIHSYLLLNNSKTTLNQLLKESNFEIALVNYNGIRILPCSSKLEDLYDIDLKKFKKVVDLIKTENPDFIIIDGPPGIGNEMISILEISDEILIVSQPFEQNIDDVIKIKKIAESFRKKKVYLVLNNGFWIEEKKIKEISEVTNLEIIGVIPHEEKIMFCLINGLSIVEEFPSHPISQIIYKISARLAGEEFNENLRTKLYFSFKKMFYFFSKVI